ncbi:MAG: HAD-IB family phosphatase [Candidatus Protochlamydia sp.]|nr:HAD-IB family phosphatase [Candidatus Protochlamydia sp.]
MRLNVFDLDHTLLKENCSYRFGAYLYKQGALSFFSVLACLCYYARHKLLHMSLQKTHQKIFNRLFKGRSFHKIQQYADAFIKESLADLYYPPVLKRLSEAIKKGDYTLILSSSPDFLVERIARDLGTTNWHGTIYEVDEQGFFSHISHVIDGHEKVEVVKRLACKMDLDPCLMVAYSDSYLDLPILKIAGTAIGVKPDYQLKRVCQNLGWEIIE